MDRNEIATLIIESIEKSKSDLKVDFLKSNDKIGYFFIDDLLPEEIAIQIYKVFPSSNEMVL
jgi:hypothetical protein